MKTQTISRPILVIFIISISLLMGCMATYKANNPIDQTPAKLLTSRDPAPPPVTAMEPEEDGSGVTAMYETAPKLNNVAELKPAITKTGAAHTKVKSKYVTKSKSPSTIGLLSQEELDGATATGGINLTYDTIMLVGDWNKIKVDIFSSLKLAAANVATETESIKISKVMKVELFAPNFTVNPLQDKPEQVLVEDGATTWEWNVTPLKSGKQSIQIKASISVIVPGYGPQYKNFPVLEKTIKVNVDSITYAKNLIIENWKWASALVALAGLGFTISTIVIIQKRNPPLLSILAI